MKMICKRFAVVFAVLSFWQLAISAAPAASKNFEKVAKVQASIEPATAKRGQTVTWKLTLELAKGWHSYPSKPLATDSGDQQYNRFKLDATPEAVFVGELKEPPTQTTVDPVLGKLRVYTDKVVWERPLVIRPQAPTGKQNIKVTVQLLVCDENRCLPPEKLVLLAPVTISTDDPVPVDPKYRDAVTSAGSSGAAPVPPSPPVARAEKPSPTDDPFREDNEISSDYQQTLAGIHDQINTQPIANASSGLLAFMLTGVFWGFVSLITPCVFPMIPITVSYFLKQSEKEHHRPITMALVYCGTIVVVLTISAVALLSFFRQLSTNPYMNFALGALFVYFALSLFGMYEIELPAGLAQFTSAREGRGGMAGTMFMALTFTIISFACVAPFLGGFGGTAAASRLSGTELVLGGLAFAATFAAPFFILALFPSLLRKIPKSGAWLNSVKVVMGFLELAAALKFFRAGELVFIPRATLFTYDFVLGIWIALMLLCGLYLLNVYRLPHDTPADHLSVPRMLFSLAFLGLGFYLLPALFQNGPGEKQRPNGTIYAWIDSFLLPEPQERANQGDLAWTGNLKQAVDDARAQRSGTGERKLVFIDFTGETCTNCKLNERTVFIKPDIKELFKPYRLVQLYTDKVPNKYYPAGVRDRFGNSTSRQRGDASVNLDFQRATFGTEQLPLYVILEPLPDGKIDVVGSYAEGKINDENAFAQFLKKPLERNEGLRADASLP